MPTAFDTKKKSDDGTRPNKATGKKERIDYRITGDVNCARRFRYSYCTERGISHWEFILATETTRMALSLKYVNINSTPPSHLSVF